jgi:hypothetical protein
MLCSQLKFHLGCACPPSKPWIARGIQPDKFTVKQAHVTDVNSTEIARIKKKIAH